MSKMTEQEILTIAKQNYETAKKAKDGIDSKMQQWQKEYNGEAYGNESDGHSQIVIKDGKKAVEWFIPNAVEPFVGKNRIVKLAGITADDVEKASLTEKLLNYQFVRNFDRYNFVYDCFKVGATEGTTVVKCGWNLEEDETVETIDNITEEQILLAQSQGIEVKFNDDGRVKLIKRTAKKNEPTAIVVKNGRFYLDPTADSINNSDYCIEEIDVTMSSLKTADIYKNLDELKNSYKDSDTSSIEQERQSRGGDYGYDNDDSQNADKSLSKMTMVEYWGDMDINGDGIAVPIVISWVGNTVIRNEENPYPDKEKPYIATPFIKTPFMFWGDSLMELLSDSQFTRSGIMRAILDNVVQSNAGFKFYRKGSLDAVNKKKLDSNIGGGIEVNGDKNDMWDGNFNAMPATIFNIFEMLQREGESLSGVSNVAQGLDSRALNTATASSIAQSAGQKRMMEIVRRYSELIKQLMRKWISYNKVYLSPEETIRISGKHIQFSPDDIDGAYDIDITVGVDGVEENKANQITMLMQQIGGLSGNVDPIVLNKLLAKLADTWGFADIAAELEQTKPPEPNPEEVAFQQKVRGLEIAKLEAEIDKIKSETHENMADANAKNVSAKSEAYGLNEKPLTDKS